MWPDHVHVCARDGADDNQRQASRVGGFAGRNQGREGLEDGLGRFKGFRCVRQEVLSGREDKVLSDEGLRSELAHAAL